MSSEDITFCSADCRYMKCFRNSKHIKRNDIPHSFSDLQDSDLCPIKENQSGVSPVERIDEYGDSTLACPNCGNTGIANPFSKVPRLYNYCPNCGTKLSSISNEVIVDGLTIRQSSENNHVTIFDNETGELKYHGQYTKKLSKKELGDVYKDYKKLKGILENNVE